MKDLQNRTLYDPSYEHDACGVGLIAHLRGKRSHEIVEQALRVLENMNHRGAENADPRTGDGAGITVQIPHEFILLQGIAVPERGSYGTGIVFLPNEPSSRQKCMEIIEDSILAEGLVLLNTRIVPVNSDAIGETARESEPEMMQLFIGGGDDLERCLYVCRRRIETRVIEAFPQEPRKAYVVSLSSRMITYKGMLSSLQLRYYYPDLLNPHFTSGIALVHSRFSTNTFPTWDLAQPFRLLGHNGEINTIRGNRGWTTARESVLKFPPLKVNGGKAVDDSILFPIVQKGMSDSASLDNVLEFFVRSGLSLPHALSMLIPESWNDKNPITAELKAFYEYHSIAFEPWDGPATLLFTDGRYAGGMLDRNGLRPCRYLITKDDLLVMASETGVLPIPASNIKEKGRLQPGKILMLDVEEGKLYRNDELKAELASAHPYCDWLAKNRIYLSNLSSGRAVKHSVDRYFSMVRAFNYTKEEIERIITPMANSGAEPVGSMGNDTPLAILSRQPQLLYKYFRQQFAQVTNPPIDPIREELVMSLSGYIGTISHNLLEPDPELCKMIKLKSPILTNREIDLLLHLQYKGFKCKTLPMLYSPQSETMESALQRICTDSIAAVNEGYNYVVLSDRGIDAEKVAIPSLLALSAVHHHLIAERKRVQVGLIVESGEPREVMHFALLFGYGASAVNPYMAFSVLDYEIKAGNIRLDYETAEKHYIKSVNKGLLKTMSKMGISTLRSYRGARIFEAIGLSEELSHSYFGGTTSKIGGIGMTEIAQEQERLHREAFDPSLANLSGAMAVKHDGQYSFRKDGEQHAWNPDTIAALQIATRLGSYTKFKEYSRMVDEKGDALFLRDLLRYKPNPISLDEVEPKESIARRFVTGAMSFGSISKEAHEAMARVMNQLGGKSNTGEGGEDAARFVRDSDGGSRRSAIKQVASGRFGVTTEYLVNADEIQIKIAQGAKPGEGGQLPGFKVDEVIAKTRHSIPGISLISPPPHHDIYSIEDLAQLIFDLKNVNPQAEISVKLVSESGIGTIAAGVTKAKADRIIISGAEGGTGASPLSSIKYAGLPMEIGLSETQQTLVLNNLRGQVTLQSDGQLKTGRDIVMAALLGAEEFGFATSALIVLGCVMMRKCHTNECPVGVATQDERLRARFKGREEYLLNFFHFLAEEVREHLAALGFRSLNEIIGRTDLLEYNPSGTTVEKAATIDLSRLTAKLDTDNALRKIKPQIHEIDTVLDRKLIKVATLAMESQQPVEVHYTIGNTDRSVGAMLSGAVTRLYGSAGLADNTIRCTFQGSAGQVFGGFLSTGITFRLEGDANDYLGKGLSGGRIIVTPPSGSTFAPQENIIAGNTLLYGATSGEVFINGRVGERFCVRNSGATAVVEGVGDHCCEYMTGGVTVVLGSVGRNFAAGMSGGVAYVYDPNGTFDYYCNMEMVELSLVEEASDRKELRSLLSKHLLYTGSPLAKHLLDNWTEEVEHFMCVMPIEYKKVLFDQKAEALKRKISVVERDY